MKSTILAAAFAGLSLVTPLQAGGFAQSVEDGVRGFNSATSAISDRLIFDPFSRLQANISQGLLSRAEDGDRALEARGLIMPEPGQQTGPLEGAAKLVSDLTCAFGEMSVTGARTMRDGMKEMAAFGIGGFARMGEGMASLVIGADGRKGEGEG